MGAYCASETINTINKQTEKKCERKKEHNGNDNEPTYTVSRDKKKND